MAAASAAMAVSGGLCLRIAAPQHRNISAYRSASPSSSHLALGRSARCSAAASRRVCYVSAGGFGTKESIKKKNAEEKKKQEEAPLECEAEYADCEPYYRGEKYPETPAALLTSRYGAYCLTQSDYLMDTVVPSRVDTRANRKRLKADIDKTCQNVTYYGLKIIKEWEGEESDVYFIKFRVWFKFTKLFTGKKGNTRKSEFSTSPMLCVTETSRFQRFDGKWLFEDSTEQDETFYKVGSVSEETPKLEGIKQAAAKKLSGAADKFRKKSQDAAKLLNEKIKE